MSNLIFQTWFFKNQVQMDRKLDISNYFDCYCANTFFQAGCQYSDCSIGRGYYGSSCGLRAGFNYGGPSGRGGNSLCGATGKFFYHVNRIWFRKIKIKPSLYRSQNVHWFFHHLLNGQKLEKSFKNLKLWKNKRDPFGFHIWKLTLKVWFWHFLTAI